MSLNSQTSAEIISEARASLKSTRVSRPITPAPFQLRSLWGDMTEGSSSNRPPSVLKMSRLPFAPSHKRPSSGVRLNPISYPSPTPHPPHTSHSSRSRSAKLIRKSHSLDQVAIPVELAESLSMLDLYTETPYLDWKIDRLKNTLAAMCSYLLSPEAVVVSEQLADKLIIPVFKLIQRIHYSSISSIPNTHLLLLGCYVAMVIYGRMSVLSSVNNSNINTISQLVFSLSRDEENDVHFMDTDCVNGMLILIQAVNKACIPEYLVYLLGALKLITSSLHCSSYIIDRFLCISIHLAEYLFQHPEGGNMTAPCLLQIVWCLRNLCDNKVAILQLTTPDTVLLITNILNMTDIHETVLYAAKICSKLATNQLFHKSVMCEQSTLPNLLTAFALNSHSHLITSKLAFTLSRLVMDDVIISTRILAIPNSIDMILQAVDTYSDLSHRDSMTCLPALTSLIGNLSLHPEAGILLSSTPSLPLRLTSALDGLTPDLYEDTEFITALLTALNNLSYYKLSIECSLQLTYSLINQLLIPSLSLTLIQQIVSCLGNLTRFQECRAIVQETRTDMFLLTLLDSTDTDVLFSSTGAIINLTSELNCNIHLLNNGLIDKLIGIMENIGLTDIQVISHSCQILWNLSGLLLTQISNHSKTSLQCKQIISYVTEYVNATTQSLSDEVIHFLQVANKLISKLNTMLSDS
ncbi:Armadillo repeat-containing protein 2-like [Oopsacas minuta]|uniref:Armadillo repeat-containing protein 2-like n=1 Tax=Oopsacas minuta TaxID=111878 RepID=A0AAV7JL87_9METZ|nr:Armadillo repeat-containing protein 2-like [Oopsacas minuta]